MSIEFISGAIAMFNNSFSLYKNLKKEKEEPENEEKSSEYPLHQAILELNHKEAKGLLEQGVDINQKANGQTPLRIAVMTGSYSMSLFLIINGADIEEADDNGNRPLHTAAFHGYYQIIEMLHAKGAKLNEKNKQDATPLIIATMNGHFMATSMLIQAGADPNIKMTVRFGTIAGTFGPLEFALKNHHYSIVNLLANKK